MNSYIGLIDRESQTTISDLYKLFEKLINEGKGNYKVICDDLIHKSLHTFYLNDDLKLICINKDPWANRDKNRKTIHRIYKTTS